MKLLQAIIRLYREAYAGLPKDAWLLSLVEFINRSGTMVFFFMTLYLTRKLGFSTPQAGWVMSVYGLGALVGAYLGGKLTDTVGAYTVQKASLMLSGATLIAVGQVKSFGPIIGLMFALAVFSETLQPANATAMSQVCPPEVRARGFALNRLATNLGVTIGPVVGGFLALIDYVYLFWVDGLTYLIAGVLFWILFKTSRPPLKESAAAAGSSSPRSPWRDVYFLKIIGLVFLMGLVFVQIFTTFPLYFKKFYGFPENRIGLLLAVNTIMIVLFEMILLNALRRRPSIQLVAVGSLLLGGGLALMPLGRGFLFAAFTVMVWTAGEMLFMPAVTTVIANHSDDAGRGNYMGVFSLAFALSLTLGPSIGAFIYDRLGADILWLVCGLTGGMIWLGFSSLRQHQPSG
jgi:predicted MFS family arabinose efflux permease